MYNIFIFFYINLKIIKNSSKPNTIVCYLCKRKQILDINNFQLFINYDMIFKIGEVFVLNVIKRCKKCERYMTCDETAIIHKAFNCNGILEKINIPCDDMYTIEDISTDKDFIQAMIDLKENDIIEYNIKISQFKTQLQQQKSSKAQTDNTPRCPHCKSTNIKPISTINRGASIAMWGMFSKKINKSFECKNCGYTW